MYITGINISERETAVKKLTLTIQVPQDFNGDDEHDLNLRLNDFFQSNGYDLIRSDAYLDVDEELTFSFIDKFRVNDLKFNSLGCFLEANDSLLRRFQKNADAGNYKGDIADISFLARYDYTKKEAGVICHYWYTDQGESRVQTDGQRPLMEAMTSLELSSEEKKLLLADMEIYCMQRHKKSCIDVLNEFRKKVGLSPVDPDRKATLEELMAGVSSRAGDLRSQAGKTTETDSHQR